MCEDGRAGEQIGSPLGPGCRRGGRSAGPGRRVSSLGFGPGEAAGGWGTRGEPRGGGAAVLPAFLSPVGRGGGGEREAWVEERGGEGSVWGTILSVSGG